MVGDAIQFIGVLVIVVVATLIMVTGMWAGGGRAAVRRQIPVLIGTVLLMLISAGVVLLLYRARFEPLLGIVAIAAICAALWLAVDSAGPRRWAAFAMAALILTVFVLYSSLQ